MICRITTSTNLQFLQAPTSRQRHQVSPSTSLPPLFARLSNRIKNATIQMCLCLPNHSALYNIGSLLLCSVQLFNTLFCSSALLLCSFSQVYSTQHTFFFVFVLFSLSHHCTTILPLSLINVYIHILTVLIQYQFTALIS